MNHLAITTQPLRRTLAAIGLCMLAALGAPAQAATTYRAKTLINYAADGTVQAAIVVPTSLSEAGHALGRFKVYMPADGSIIDVSRLADGSSMATGYAINSAGQVVGAGGALGRGIVVRNLDGSYVNLGLLPGDLGSIGGMAINDAGQVAGESSDLAGWCGHRAVLGHVSGTPPLQALGRLVDRSGAWSVPNAISPGGRVAGWAYVSGATCGAYPSYHAFVASATGLVDLHTTFNLPSTVLSLSNARAINDQGIVVGRYAVGGTLLAPVFNAVVWNTTNGTWRDLGPGTLEGVNASGTVVGTRLNAAGAALAAVVGDAAGGPLVDLATRVPGMPTDLVLRRGVAINDAGQILVEGSAGGYSSVGILLTPISSTEPAPAAPSNLVVTASTPTQVSLRWADNASNETGQSLERCVGTTCVPLIALPANATTYTDTTVGVLTTYTYRVRADGNGGASAFSNAATTTTPQQVISTVPAAPSGLIAIATAAGPVQLSWVDNASTEAAYNVYRCTGSRCTPSTLVAALGANATTFTDTTVARGTRYTYRVRAVNAVGTSAPSASVTVTTAP